MKFIKISEVSRLFLSAQVDGGDVECHPAAGVTNIKQGVCNGAILLVGYTSDGTSK